MGNGRKIRDPALRRYRDLWADEMHGAALYRALADASGGDERRRGIFLALADAEERHARHWQRLLADAGVGPLAPPRRPLRVRVLGALARRFGAEAVLPIVLRFEAADAAKYHNVPEAPASMSAAEAAHGRVLTELGGETRPGGRIAAAEGRHRTFAGGALRAAVFGVLDGLLSNLALVMGVAGGSRASGSGAGKLVLLAGVAELVGGAFSMATGEWVSVQSQRELYEREIAVEAEELRQFPDEEREELALIYQAKGVPPEEAEALAGQLMRRPETALDTLAREELGIDPKELASPWVAAISSFLSFALGAFVPVVPFLVGSGAAATVAAPVLAIAAALGVGALTSVFTGKSAGRAGLRMATIGALSAAVTYGIGSGIGVAIG